MSHLFRVWCPDRDEYPGDGRVVNTFDEASAAEEWARQDDWYSGEFSIAGSRTEVVLAVTDEEVWQNRGENDEVPVAKFKVWGECEPVYYAREEP